MFDTIAPRYDLVNRIMTFRLDVRWRRRAVRDLALAPGSRVLDLASGTGDLCIDLEPGRPPTDLGRPELRDARRRPVGCAARAGRHPAPAGARRTVDGVTCGFALRNLVELPGVLRRARLAWCGPAAASRCSTSASRSNRVVRWGNGIYFGKVVPRIGGWLSDPAAYRYLPKSVAYLPEPPEMLAMLRSAGFADAAHRPLSGGITQLLTGTRS
jgi:demethylmenaquinone methyltransferase / 2-methoxy-6-polyprenyl-1,4-benzoquinol methylase